MVNTPTDNFVNWANRAYPDEKTKLFPISVERLCFYIKYTSFPIDHAPSLITYLSSHPKHGSEWCIRIREHPIMAELLNTPRKNTKVTNDVSRPKCVVVESEKAKGYMIVSNMNENDPKHKEASMPKESVIIPPHLPVPTPQLKGKRQRMPFLPNVNEKRKKLLKGLAEKDKSEVEKRRLREEIKIKDQKISKLNALLGQYKLLLIDQPETELTVVIDQTE